MNEALFKYTRGPRNAEVIVVAESWGRNEEEAKKPLVGASGTELKRMLESAGLNINDFLLTNCIHKRPPYNDVSAFFSETQNRESEVWRGLKPSGELKAGVEELWELIREVKPKLIIAAGNLALWALTNEWKTAGSRGRFPRRKVPAGIVSFRRSELFTCPEVGYSCPVMPVLHPALVLRQWEWRAWTVNDFRVAKKFLQGEITWGDPAPKAILGPNFKTLESYLWRAYAKVLRKPQDVVIDVETAVERITCCGIQVGSGGEICVIPFVKFEEGKLVSYFTLDEQVKIYKLLFKILRHKNCLLAGQNIIYDLQYLYKELLVDPKATHDTMLMHHLIWPGTPKGLDFLSSIYCKHHSYWKDDNKEWNLKQDFYTQWIYNSRDIAKTMEILQVLKPVVEQRKELWKEQLENNNLAYRMMQTGVKIDEKKRGELTLKLIEAVDKIKLSLSTIRTPDKEQKSPWFQSPKQLADFLYKDLGQKPIFNRATGEITTNKEALTELAAREPLLRPIVNYIEDLRTASIFSRNFLRAKLEKGGRMRCSYNVAGTDTFRWSSTKNAFSRGTNLQNIPSAEDDEERKARIELPPVKEIFIADPGYVIFEADLSGADAQVVAWDAEDEDLMEAFKAGLKVHKKNAEDMWGAGAGEDPKRYYEIKRGVHGTNYGAKARTIATVLNWTVHEADQFQKRWFSIHPKIKLWQERKWRELQETRTISNAFGYKITYFDRPENTYKKALAWTPQSTVAISCNRGIRQLEEKFPEVIPLLQVHDSGVFQTPISCRSKIPLYIKALRNPVPYSSPLYIPWDIKVSERSWGECKKAVSSSVS